MTTDNTKHFHLGDVLSITTGWLLSPRKMSGVYDILNWMTGDNLYTHQLGRASRECAPYILRQHPQLASVTPTGLTPDNFTEHMARWIEQFGETLPIEKLPAHAHEIIDPISELAEKVHPDKIIGIKV